jgi:hypothetical protein
MGVVGACDVDDVHRGIVEHGVKAFVDPGQVGRFGLGPSSLRCGAHDADDVDAEAAKRFHMGDTDETDADNADLDVRESHGRFLLIGAR